MFPLFYFIRNIAGIGKIDRQSDRMHSDGISLKKSVIYDRINLVMNNGNVETKGD